MKRRDLLAAAGLGAAAVAGMAWFAQTRREQLVTPVRSVDSPGDVVPIFYTADYAGSAHGFETTRKAEWIARSLQQNPIPGLTLRGHPALSEADMLAVHSEHYVRAVRTGTPRALAESQGFPWDPALWKMVCASNGGVCAATTAALQHGVAGALSSGLHHARRDHGAGFCTFNGLALAAVRAQAAGRTRVLLIDLDAHCGGGTHSLLGDQAWFRQLDVAVDAFDHYLPSGDNTLDLVRKSADYLPVIAARLEQLREVPFDLCLYNAGVDPHQHCPVGGLGGIDGSMLAERDRQVFSWCRGRRLPVAFVMAGGYLGPQLAKDALVDLHRNTLLAAGLKPDPTRDRP